MDKDVSKDLQRSLKKLGIKFHLKHAVTSVKATTKGTTVSYKKRDSEEEQEGLTKEEFKILMSHDPSHWDYIVQHHQKNFHLTFHQIF